MTCSNTRAVKRGHRSGHSTLTSRAAERSRASRGPRSTARLRQRRAGGRVQLARDAVHAEAVGPVRRDLELEHVEGDRQHLLQAACPARARRRASQLVEHHDPSPSAPSSSSLSARIMPSESDAAQLRARRAACRRASPRPGRATATVWPAATLGAPQTIVAGSPPSPSVARVQTLSRSASGCCSASSTRPTTKRSAARHAVVVDRLDLRAGHRQALLDRRARRAAGRSIRAARAAGPSSELLQEAQVVLEVQAQVGDAVLEHRDPLDAEAQGEALHLLGVVAGRVAPRSWRRTSRRWGRPRRRRAPRASPRPCTGSSASRRA